MPGHDTATPPPRRRLSNAVHPHRNIQPMKAKKHAVDSYVEVALGAFAFVFSLEQRTDTCGL